MNQDINKTILPWMLSEEELYKRYKTSSKGLSDTEATIRYSGAKNKHIANSRKSTVLTMFLAQFKNALVLILIGAAIISFFLGERTDSFIIILIVIINAGMGFIQ